MGAGCDITSVSPILLFQLSRERKGKEVKKQEGPRPEFGLLLPEPLSFRLKGKRERGRRATSGGASLLFFRLSYPPSARGKNATASSPSS